MNDQPQDLNALGWSALRNADAAPPIDDLSPRVLQAIIARGSGGGDASNESGRAWPMVALFAGVIAIAAGIYGFICWQSLDNPLSGMTTTEMVSQ